MKNPRDIQMIDAWTFIVPTYDVTDEGITDGPGIKIEFCRGDKSNPEVPRQNGVFVESLLEAIVQRLKAVNVGDLATRETSTAITNIEQGQMWIEKRSNDRKIRGVQGTYQK
jgi:hypothetical protein